MKKVANNGLQSSLSEKSLALNSFSSEDIQANDIDDLDMAIEPTIKKSSVNIKTAPLQMVRIIVCEIYCTKKYLLMIQTIKHFRIMERF